jgi:predicted permease
MIVFLVLIAVGFTAGLLKLLTKPVLDSVARFTVKVISPIMILTLIVNTTTREMIFNSVPLLFIAIMLIGFMLVSGILGARIFGLSGNTARIHMAQSAFGNIGLIGISLVTSVFGSDCTLYVTIFTLVDQCLLWTLGTYLATPADNTDVRKFDWKRLINPMIFAIIIGMVMVLLNIHPDGVVFKTLTNLGGTTKYIAMVYAGGSLCFIKIKDVIARPSVFGIVLFKMLLVPVIVFFALMSLNIIEPVGIFSLTLLTALPSVITVSLIAQTTGSDYEYAAVNILVTTLFSMITIPFIIWFMKTLMNVF